MIEWFKNFHFDWQTCVFTVLIIPLIVFFVKIIRTHIKEWGRYLLEGVLYAFSRRINHSIAAALSMKRYCRMQLGVEKFKYLYVPSSTEIKLDIDKMFVSLVLKNHTQEENNYNHNNLLELGKRIKVMGDPGSGKSSLIKRVFRDRCLFGLTHPKKAILPVLIELKYVDPPVDCKTSELGKWFYEYIRGEVAKLKVYKMSECFESYSKASGVLVLLDGLDEVSSVKYSLVESAINGLSNYLNDYSPNNVIVLTMRTQFYQQIKNDFIDNFQHSTFLKSFSPADIYEFLTRWHFKKESESNIARIYRSLTDRPTLREMCSNPLILSMYVAEDQASNGSLSPASRTDFYKKVTEELLLYRRLVQKKNTTTFHATIKEQRERILGRIAYNHIMDVNQPKNNLSWQDAIVVIKDVLKCDDAKAKEIFNDISKETGLITEERVEENFRFIHLTFCEFLAAFEIVQETEDGWEELIEIHESYTVGNLEDRSRLLEVIPFTAGLLSRVKKSKILEKIEILNDYTLMTRCFLETKLYEHPCWENFIINASKNLLNFSGKELDEKWLFDLHLFNVVVKDAEWSAQNLPAHIPIDLSIFYKKLLENQKSSLHKILAAYASQDASAVFRLSEICKMNLADDFPEIIIENCDQVPFLGLVREQIIQNIKEYEKWAALVAESALRKGAVYTLVNDMPPVDVLRERIKQNNKYRIWYYKEYVKETLFTQCLTLGSSTELYLKNAESVLELTMEFKTPYENRLQLLLRKILIDNSFFLLTCLIICTSISFIIYRGISGGLLMFRGIIVSTTFIFALSYFIAWRWLIGEEFYRVLFTNLTVVLGNGTLPSHYFFMKVYYKWQRRHTGYKMFKTRSPL